MKRHANSHAQMKLFSHLVPSNFVILHAGSLRHIWLRHQLLLLLPSTMSKELVRHPAPQHKFLTLQVLRHIVMSPVSRWPPSSRLQLAQLLYTTQTTLVCLHVHIRSFNTRLDRKSIVIHLAQKLLYFMVLDYYSITKEYVRLNVYHHLCSTRIW